MNRPTIHKKTQQQRALTSARSSFRRNRGSSHYHTKRGGAGSTNSNHSIDLTLTNGASNDPLEVEADQVADNVLAIPANRDIRDKPLQTLGYGRGVNEDGGILSESVGSVLAGTGIPLSATLQQDMNNRFGHDFSQVRVHFGTTEAAESTGDLNANAFTFGNDIVFGDSQYAPETHSGRRLIAHELTHVLQQHRTGASGIQRQSIGGSRPPFESTNYAFDTYNLTESHLSDPDITARFSAMFRDDLVAYRSQYIQGRADPVVIDYLDGLIAANTPVLLRVEVAPGSRSHFPQVPGTGSGTHWVGVASRTARKPIVRAVLSPAVPSTDPYVAGLTWTGPDVTADAGNPLQAEVGRTAGRRPVTATLGGITANTTLWSVFSTIRANSAPALNTNTSATRFSAGATVNFTATILPRSIITDADHPDLSGPNTVAPPDNGTQICGNALAGGVDSLWDISRRIRQRAINPAGLVPTPAADACLWSNHLAYPANFVEGNDDTHTGDENNDPYGNGGVLTSRDTPNDFIRHTKGSDGDRFEIRAHFQEIARLELNRGWWRISRALPWRFHLRTRKDAATHRWVDDGSSTALDNNGF